MLLDDKNLDIKEATYGTCNLDDECARKPGRRVSRMAKIVFALNQSLDGFVDHDHKAFQPDSVLFHHFIDDLRDLAGCSDSQRRN